MSKLTDDQLDDLFRNRIAGFEKDAPSDSWPFLAKEVKKQNFLTFGWKHFNIFQIIAGIAIILSLSTLIISTKQQKLSVVKPENNSKNTIPPTHKSIENNNTITPPSTYSSKNPSDNPSIPEKGNVKKEDILISPMKPTPADSILTTVVKDSVNTTKEEALPTPIKRKIITVIKRDTLVIKDTINVRKKSKTKNK